MTDVPDGETDAPDAGVNLIVGIAMLLRLAEEGAYEVRRKSELKLTVIFVSLLLIITSFSHNKLLCPSG